MCGGCRFHGFKLPAGCPIRQAANETGDRDGRETTRLAVGGSTYVSSLVHRLLRDVKERRTVATHERALDAEKEAIGK